MDSEKSLREICLLLMDEIVAYQLLVGEISGPVEPAFLASRLAHSRRRAALRLSAIGEFPEIEKRAREFHVQASWKSLLLDRTPKMN